MKELFLIRHAKSDWDHPGLSDHDRELNERGRRDAPRMGRALRERGVKPGVVASSTALRAALTAEVVAWNLGFPAERIEFRSDLYLASARVVLAVVQGLDENEDTALVFGHNPGMHEATNRLAGDGALEDFPTLAVARLALQAETWGEVDWGCARLVEFLVPRALPEGP